MNVELPFPDLDANGLWLGRVERYGIGPCVVTIRDGEVFEVTSRTTPTVRDVLEQRDPAGYLKQAQGRRIGEVDDLGGILTLLAPCDLQVIKAAGVTFAASLVERVIEEGARGDPCKAEALREKLTGALGTRLADLRAGSDAALRLAEALQAEGLWSAYLEVGLGREAEIFTKAPVLSAVGYGGKLGVPAGSRWNTSEPEIVLAVNSKAEICGATLGNDLTLCDREGRSALLLARAKDTVASCALGPMIRLFDQDFTLADISGQKLSLSILGGDGFSHDDSAQMATISRDPADLVAQMMGGEHHYPDGAMLFLGTPVAPPRHRADTRQPFAHHPGDQVSVACNALGMLHNTVEDAALCPQWRSGITSLMRNLGARELL